MASPQPQLRCLSTQPDEGSAAAVAALPAEALNDILDFVFPTLQIDPVPADAIPRDAPIAEQIEAWAGKHGLKAKAARSAAKLILGLRQGLIHGVLPAEALREDCGALGLPDSHTDALTRVWKERGKQLCSTVAMAKHPSSVASLVDAQWRFGVTASTDDVGRVGATFVQLKLTLLKDGALADEHMELSLSQFYDLLAKLERAKSFVDFMGGVTAAAATSSS